MRLTVTVSNAIYSEASRGHTQGQLTHTQQKETDNVYEAGHRTQTLQKYSESGTTGTDQKVPPTLLNLRGLGSKGPVPYKDDTGRPLLGLSAISADALGAVSGGPGKGGQQAEDLLCLPYRKEPHWDQPETDGLGKQEEQK